MFLWFLLFIGLFCLFLGLSFSLRSRYSTCLEGFVKTSSVAYAAISARIGVAQREIVQNHVLDEAPLADIVAVCVLCFYKSSDVITRGFFFSMYACILFSPSRMLASKTYTASSHLY